MSSNFENEPINKILDDTENQDFQLGVANTLDFLINDGVNLDTIKFFLSQKDNLKPEMKKGALVCLDFLEGKNSTQGIIEFIILFAMVEYTRNNSSILDWLHNLNEIKSVEINDDNSVAITLNSGRVIKFSLLSQYLEDFASIEQTEKQILESDKRIGHCHLMSMLTSQKLGYKNDVVSGYVYRFAEGKYLHSWIETKMGRNEVVIDYTLNAIINKDGYKYLQKAQEISRLSSITIKNDFKSGLLDKMTEFGIGDKEYVIFRDAIKRDVERIWNQIGGSDR